MNIRTPIRAALSIALMAAVALVFTSTPALAILNSDLVEYWKLDDLTLDITSAEVDPNHNGTLNEDGPGSGALVAGKFGQAIDLESSGGGIKAAFIEVGGDAADFDFFDQDMSVSLWYTTEELYANWQALIAKGEGSNWRLARLNATNNLDFSPGAAGYGELDDPNGGWHHVVGTSSTTVGTRLYIDGDLVGASFAPNSYDGSDGAFSQLTIGANPEATERAWDGKIDDVAIWNRTLTASEVSLIWNDGDGESIESLLAQPENLLTLQVDIVSGSMAIHGDPDRTNDISFYDITSPGDSLDDSGWSSLADQDYEGSGSPDGSGDGWEEFPSSGSGFLAESFLQGSTTIDAGAVVSIGDGYNAGVGTQNLVFTYLNGFGEEVEGLIDYVSFNPADLNKDGTVDGLDLGIQLGNWGQNVTSVQGELNGTQPVDGLDLGILLGAWGTSSLSAASVPEPSSVFLLSVGAVGLGYRRRKLS